MIKKKTNRFMVFFIIAFLEIVFFSGYKASVSAVNNEAEKVIAENNAYIRSNYVSLFDKAIKSDFNISDNITNIQSAYNSDSVGDDFVLISYVVQDKQLLMSDNDDSVLCALTTVSAIAPARAGGSTYKYDYDSTVSVKAYSTIYYSTKVSGGLTYYCLTSASGGYTILDSSVAVTSQSVHCVETGLNTSSFTIDKHSYANPSSNSWSTSTGFSDYIYLTDYGLFGAKYTLNLKRTSGSSTWSFTLNNIL